MSTVSTDYIFPKRAKTRQSSNTNNIDNILWHDVIMDYKIYSGKIKRMGLAERIVQTGKKSIILRDKMMDKINKIVQENPERIRDLNRIFNADNLDIKYLDTKTPRIKITPYRTPNSRRNKVTRLRRTVRRGEASITPPTPL